MEISGITRFIGWDGSFWTDVLDSTLNTNCFGSLWLFFVLRSIHPVSIEVALT